MKNIFIAFCTLLLTFSLYAQQKATVPVLIAPTDASVNHMPITQLNWYASVGYHNVKYQVEISNSIDFNDDDILFVIESTLPAIYTPSLKFNSTYFWRVRATDDKTPWSDWSEIRSYTTLNDLNPRTSASTAFSPSANIKWESHGRIDYNGISKFEVLLSKSPDFDPEEESFQRIWVEEDIDGLKERDITVDGLSFATRYYWTVRAYNSATDLSYVDTSAWIPARALNITASNDLVFPTNASTKVSPTVVLIVKTDAAECNYVFQLSLDEDFTSPQEYISSDKTLTNYDTLLFDKTYYWRTCYEYNGIYSDWSTTSPNNGVWKFTTISAPELNNPANGAIINENSSLSTKQLAGVEYFTAEISTSKDFPAGKTYTATSKQNSISLKAFVDFEPEENVTYYWRVQAVNYKNASKWSEVRNFTVKFIVGIEDFSANETAIYPNPNNGSFNIEVESSIDNAVIRIFDLTGRVRYNETANLIEKTPYQINTNLSKGLYILEINNNKGIRTNKKFTVQ